MRKGANKVMECLGVRKGESVLIVVDTSTPLSIGENLFDAAKELEAEVMMLTMLPRSRHGEQLPDAIAESMKNADVVIAPTTFSLTHTQAKINACKAGTRLASMPTITEEMMASGGLTADYDRVNEIAVSMIDKLKDVKEFRIVTDSGTDIILDLEGSEWFMDTGLCREPGCSGNLPAGELYIAPQNANGRFVVDGSMSGIGILKSPLEFTVRDRYVTGIRGEQADKLISIIDSAGKEGRNIAELGIGINPNAKLIGNVLEDEKVGGTVHIALGDSSGFGGDVVAGIHLDGIITRPELFIDSEEFIINDYIT